MADEQLLIDVGVNLGNSLTNFRTLSDHVDTLGQKMEHGGKQSGGFFDGIIGKAAGLGLAVTGIGGLAMGIGNLASSMVSGNAQMEDFNTQFEVMTGSAKNAQKLMGDLQKMGAQTPFEFPDLAKSTQTLLAFGVAQKDILPDLHMLGDISGGNKEKLDSLSLVFGQVASNGKLMGGDLLQMINAGFNPLQIISEKTGRSMADLRDDMSKGKISFDMVRDAMQTATSSGGQFNGMMDKQSHTFNGLMSTLQDNIGTLGRTLAAPIFDKLKDGLEGVIDFLNKPEVMGAISGLADLIANTLGGAFDFLGKVFTAFQGNGQPLLDFFNSLGGPGSPMAAVGTFLVNLIANFNAFIAAIQGGQDPLQAIGDLIGKNFGALMNLGGELLKALGDALPGIMAKLGEWGQAFLNWLGPQIPPLLAKLWELAQQVGAWLWNTGLPWLIDHLGQWGKAFIDWVGPQIPPLLANLGQLLGQLGDWLLNTALPFIVQHLGEWGGAFLGWIGKDVLPFIGQKLGEFGAAVWNWVTGGGLAETIVNIGKWGNAFTEWVGKDALPFIGQKLGEFGNAVWTWIINDALPTIVQKLGEWGRAFLDWIGKDVLPFLGQKLNDIWTNLTNWIGNTAKNILTAVVDIGKNIVQGIWNGVSGAWNNFISWLGNQIKNTLPGFVKDWLGIHSPSTVFAEIGGNIIAGLQGGINNDKNMPADAMTTVLGNLVQAAFDFLNKHGDPAKSLPQMWRDAFNDIFEFTTHAWGPQIYDQMGAWLTRIDNLVHSKVDDMVNYWNSKMADMGTPDSVGGGAGSGSGGSGGGGGGGSGNRMFGAVGAGGGISSRQPIYVTVVVQDPLGNQRTLDTISVGINNRQRDVNRRPSVVTMGAS